MDTKSSVSDEFINYIPHPVILAFDRFKNMHYSALKAETKISRCKTPLDQLEAEKHAKSLWEDVHIAERNFKEILISYLGNK